ncbi:DUF445 domain-containing protein [Catenovulum sp. SM1970]|uniref:DUF445 domain-containing protein n=1 Tax=Marinifaba aquimaris TaxID=2741323 RepID=UPI001571622B|nr:DUF445 domain-containing protein [Marinifaba aquimaris]NTS75721.1 DUF445 domain-containing protein [Marinifaba aquimaris]
MNKSLLTNLTAALLVILGTVLNNAVIFSMGIFALSGAVTNWLAVHMLFEKVPGLYGSGVIPARFEEFKAGIRHLMMSQFFTVENIDRFLSDQKGQASHFDLTPIIGKVDLSPAFDSLVKTIEESSFGSMLSMFGGVEAIEPLRQPFIEKMQNSLIEISTSDKFSELLREELEQPDVVSGMQEKVADIITKRLDELTPELVKDIIQDMIRTHLGWLVVWGGVFGGLIGLLAAFIPA